MVHRAEARLVATRLGDSLDLTMCRSSGLTVRTCDRLAHEDASPQLRLGFITTGGLWHEDASPQLRLGFNTTGGLWQSRAGTRSMHLPTGIQAPPTHANDECLHALLVVMSSCSISARESVRTPTRHRARANLRNLSAAPTGSASNVTNLAQELWVFGPCLPSIIYPWRSDNLGSPSICIK